jgi:hypothetical protein
MPAGGVAVELTREDGLKAPKLQISEPITLPSSGATVRVRELTAGERAAMDDVRWKVEGDKLALNREVNAAAWIAWCACDISGIRIFKDEDVDALKFWPARDAMAVSEKAAELNRLGTDDVEAEAKNS